MNGWKTAFVILLIILILENVLIFWTVLEVNKDTEKTYQCYYDVCNEYPSANFDPNSQTCFCYDYDMLGNLIVGDTKYMG